MKLMSRIAFAAFALAGIAVAMPQAAHAGCTLLSGTADGFNKQQAVTRAQQALNDYVVAFRRKRGMRNATVSPAKAPPNPYWRSGVRRDLYLKPDIRTSRSYTVCWKGVISPAVCTSGAKLCTVAASPAVHSEEAPAAGEQVSNVTSN